MSVPTPLEKERLKYHPPLPKLLHHLKKVGIVEEKVLASGNREDLQPLFPKTFGQPTVRLISSAPVQDIHALRVGVVFSGGQAPGGHNVIVGLFDALQSLHKECELMGFLGGPSGIIEGKYKKLAPSRLDAFRNMGGFDLLGSGRTKIETEEQLGRAVQTVQSLKLDGLVIIGGDDSNTNAAILAEFFLAKGCQTRVIGVPKTIDGDLKNDDVEISFGFDTATKTFSELIGNIARDALSAKKYTHFVKLMGRSASHVTLECALQTHPNCALIGEEIAAKKLSLVDVAEQMGAIVRRRAEEGKHYGVVLIPEGLVEFVPEVKQLISELNTQLAGGDANTALAALSPKARDTFSLIPKEIQEQLLLDRDPHGNVKVSQIATEKLLIHLVQKSLKKEMKFSPVNHFLGYEGRSGFPSNFDTHYCYALGYVAAALLSKGKTGYMAYLRHLVHPVEKWEGGGIPITSLLHLEERKGKKKPVIKKALVDLEGAPFKQFASQRETWAIEDEYRYPGPIQFGGPPHLVNASTLTLHLEQSSSERATSRHP